jgi:hypothetical protein
MPHTPDEMMSAVTESLAARTGRSLEQWLALVRSSRPNDRREVSVNCAPTRG